MTDNVKKMFKMLGVEPNEKFKIKDKEHDVFCFYKIDENLNVFFAAGSVWEKSCIKLADFLTEKYTIIKLLNIKKLRDLTAEEYKKWYDKNCGACGGSCCSCLFNCTACLCGKYCWVNHKDLYSDKFLDQEVEIPK